MNIRTGGTLGKLASPRNAARGLSRREFLLLGLLGSGGLGLTLSGCSSGSLFGDDIVARRDIINDWLDAANAFETSRFLALHTENVAYYSYQARNPSTGRDGLWSAFEASAGNHLENAFSFGNEQSVCIQTSSVDLGRSHCYILVFEDELIDRVYEYAAQYNITNDPLIQERKRSGNQAALAEQIDTIDRMTDALNERDYQSYLAGFHPEAAVNGFLSTDPLEGSDAIQNAGERFFEAYPNAAFRHYRTFGQGNLVCQQLIVEHGPVRSLSSVHIFKDRQIIRSVEYLSHARLIEI